MARKPMVTRTFETTICEVMTVNTDIASVDTMIVRLPRTYKTDDEMLKACKLTTETDTLKVVKIVTSWTEEKLYGMSEKDFMMFSVELDPVTRRPIDSEEDEEEDEEI